MKKIQCVFLSVSFFACAMNAFAGGPLLTDQAGNPVVYPASAMPIAYTVDQGDLGAYSNSEAVALVDDCFAVWQAVPTVSLSLRNAGFLPQDINKNNYGPYFTITQAHNPLVYGINPVIFDSDGGIIDALYGTGASDNIIGFSGSDTDSGGTQYIEGMSVLNGRFTQPPYNWQPAQFRATFVHEFGHFIGLDHTQINGRFVHDGNTSNDIYIPTMYPTSTDNDTPLGTLKPDDEAAVTMLYPASDAVVKAAYGKIHGTLHWLSGLPVRGANVIAVKQGDELMSQFSCVSDYAVMGDGAFDLLVTPGAYTFIVEPVNPRFYGGSGVGPYSIFPFSRSFIFPVVRTTYSDPVTFAAWETKTVRLAVLRNWLRPVPGITAWLWEFLLSLLPTAG